MWHAPAISFFYSSGQVRTPRSSRSHRKRLRTEPRHTNVPPPSALIPLALSTPPPSSFALSSLLKRGHLLVLRFKEQIESEECKWGRDDPDLSRTLQKKIIPRCVRAAVEGRPARIAQTIILALPRLELKAIPRPRPPSPSLATHISSAPTHSPPHRPSTFPHLPRECIDMSYCALWAPCFLWQSRRRSANGVRLRLALPPPLAPLPLLAPPLLRQPPLPPLVVRHSPVRWAVSPVATVLLRAVFVPL